MATRDLRRPEEKPATKVRAALADDRIAGRLTSLYNFATYWRFKLRFITAVGERDVLHARLMLRTSPLRLEKVEAWVAPMFIQQTEATGNFERYVKIRGITKRRGQTPMDECPLKIREQKKVGGLTPEALEIMESMLGMIQS